MRTAPRTRNIHAGGMSPTARCSQRRSHARARSVPLDTTSPHACVHSAPDPLCVDDHPILTCSPRHSRRCACSAGQLLRTVTTALEKELAGVQAELDRVAHPEAAFQAAVKKRKRTPHGTRGTGETSVGEGGGAAAGAGSVRRRKRRTGGSAAPSVEEIRARMAAQQQKKVADHAAALEELKAKQVEASRRAQPPARSGAERTAPPVARAARPAMAGTSTAPGPATSRAATQPSALASKPAVEVKRAAPVTPVIAQPSPDASFRDKVGAAVCVCVCVSQVRHLTDPSADLPGGSHASDGAVSTRRNRHLCVDHRWHAHSRNASCPTFPVAADRAPAVRAARRHERGACGQDVRCAPL